MSINMDYRRSVATRGTAEGPARPEELFYLFKDAGRLDLLNEAVIRRMSLTQARAFAASAPVSVPAPAAPSPAAAATTLPVTPALPALAAAPLDPRAINQHHRDVLAARQSGRTPSPAATPPVAQQPAPIHANGTLNVRELYRRFRDAAA